MPAPRKYPPELRERSMRLVAEARREDPELSLNAAVVRVGQRVGVNPDTLRGWCKQAAIDAKQSTVGWLDTALASVIRADFMTGGRGVGRYQQTLNSSFSSVSTSPIARVGAFCSIFQDLQVLHTFAPLQIQNFSKFC